MRALVGQSIKIFCSRSAGRLRSVTLILCLEWSQELVKFVYFFYSEIEHEKQRYRFCYFEKKKRRDKVQFQRKGDERKRLENAEKRGEELPYHPSAMNT